jgi:hypothetical protein
MWELWLVTITSHYLTTTASGMVLQVLGGVATVLNIGGWLVVSNHPKIYVCQLESSSRRPVKLQQPCLDFFGNLNLLFNTLPLSPIWNNYPPLQAPPKKLRDRWPQSQVFSLVGGCGMKEFGKGGHQMIHTVDGRNPAPDGRCFIPWKPNCLQYFIVAL